MKITSIIGIGLFIAVAIALVPLGILWALNTLFGLAIGYTIKTWLAALLLGMVFQANSNGRASRAR